MDNPKRVSNARLSNVLSSEDQQREALRLRGQLPSKERNATSSDDGAQGMGAGVQMTQSDITERALNWASDAQVAHTYRVSIRADLSTITMVRELVAEVERLRAGGPWVEHVERMNAMKRERDGDCICDGNPATTDGPDEFCPWHGRSYRELVEGLESQAAEAERLREACKTLGEIIHQTNRMVLDITGLHHLIGEDGDGDWAAVWENLAELGGQRRPVRVTTTAQLDALPVGTVVLDDTGDVLRRNNPAGGWLLLGFIGLHLPVPPARVLWNPEDRGPCSKGRCCLYDGHEGLCEQ